MTWYSARVRMVVLIDPEGADEYSDSVFLFRSNDGYTAFERALMLGKAEEKEYVNAEGNRVRYRLKEVISLDCILNQDLDGAEVCCMSMDLEDDTEIPFDASFSPERSRPEQTI